MIIRDLEGNEYTLEANSSTNIELNGNKSLSFIIHPSDNNKLFIEDVDKLWEVIDADDVVYKIIYLNPRGKGDSLTVQVKAVPKSFDDLNADRVYERIDEHMTAFDCFNRIFSDTDYTFVLLDSFSAVQWEGFADGDTRLEMFKNALNRYGAEFELLGNEFRIRHMIGRDTQFMYHYKLNASNISKEEDASNYWTYIKGFGDYGLGSSEDGTNDDEPKLEMEYMSPLAELVGVRHAPPLKDGRITDENTMMTKLKDTVDNSVQLNVSTTLHDLRDQGYPLARPQVGDRVFLVDDRIKVNYEMRVVSLTEIRDVKDRLIKVSVDLGTDPMAKRRQSNLNTAADQIRDLLKGRIRLPISAFDETVARISKALLDAETEVSFGENGIIAVDKNDPNKFVIFNSEGIGVSVDGGATFKQAITSEGVNAEQIIGINSEFVRSSWRSDDGSMYIDGNQLLFDSTLDGIQSRIKLMQNLIGMVYNSQDKSLSMDLNPSEGLTLNDNHEGTSITFDFTGLVFRKNGDFLGGLNYEEFDDGATGVTVGSGQLRMTQDRIETPRNGNRHLYIIPYGEGRVRARSVTGEYYDFQGSGFIVGTSIHDRLGLAQSGDLELSAAYEMRIRSFQNQLALRIGSNINAHKSINMQGNTITNESDRRLKKDEIVNEIDSLKAIESWEFAGFNWIDEDRSKERQFGIIAQSAPEIAFEGENKYLQIDNFKQLSMTTHAVQQLSKKIDEQQEEITKLKKLVNELVDAKE